MARRRHSNRRRRGRFAFLYKVLSMLVICAVVVVALTLFFRVDHVEVSGQKRYTQEEIIDATGVKGGDNLFLLNKYTVANRILAALPYIEQIRISRDLPDVLVVAVEECETPLAMVQGGSAWLFSDQGKIVEKADFSAAQEYTVVDGCELLAPSVGTYVAFSSECSYRRQGLLDLLAALKSAGKVDQVNAIHLGDAAVLTMEYADRFTVELPYGADYEYKLRALAVVVEKLETNQTGTIQLTRDDGQINFIEN